MEPTDGDNWFAIAPIFVGVASAMYRYVVGIVP